MTMNTRQASAFRELIRHEERSRDKWVNAHGNSIGGAGSGAGQQQQQQQQNGFYQTNSQMSPQGAQFAIRPSTGQVSAAPLSFAHRGHGTTMHAPHPIYSQAVRVGTPKLVDSNENELTQTLQRKVVRTVEVPYSHEVKVPIKTRAIVPVQVQKKVKTTRLVEFPTTKQVQEEYTEIVHQPAIRQREVWVKKIINEKYMKPVTQTKTRTVSVPTTELQRVDDYEVVSVTEQQAIEVDGFRIDNVEDTKLVEVEEWQNYQLIPRETGQSQVIGTRDLGNNPRVDHHLSRRVGKEVYQQDDPRGASIEMDPLSPTQQQTYGATGTFRPKTSAAFKNNAYNTLSSSQELEYTTSSGGAAAQGSWLNRAGLRVRNSDSGVQVTRVLDGTPAQRAGLHTGDQIAYANHRPTRSQHELQTIVERSSGPVLLQVSRRGFQKLMLTVHL